MLMKARSHEKKDELSHAHKLYQAVLQIFPKNKRAQQGLANLNIPYQKDTLLTSPQEAVDQLIKLYNKGQLLAVVEQAHTFTEQYPETFIIWNILGVSAAQIGMLNKAIEAFKKSISLRPDYAETYSNMGNVLKDQGKMEEAIKAYENALLLKPDLAETYSNMGVALQSQGKLEEAIKVYKKSILLKPDYSEAYSNMGNVLQAKGNLDEAINFYNKSVLLQPDDSEVYNNMGNIYRDQGDLEKAIEAYNKSILLNPDYAKAFSNMGVAFQDQGKFEEAIEAHKKSILLKPDYAEAYNNLGVALQSQGKLEEAVKTYNKSILLKPDYAEAYNNIGVALQSQGKLEEAITVYKKSIFLKSDYARPYNNMGNVLKVQGKLEEAITVYKKSISLKPDYADAYSNMGVALQSQGKLEEAITVYKKSILLKPDFAKAYNNMGNVLKDQGKTEEAIKSFKNALLLKPDFAEAFNNMGNAFQGQNKLGEAIEAYTKALSIKPDYDSARAQRLHQQAHICDWTAIEEDRKLIPELGIFEKSVSPFFMLSLEDAPDLHHQRSKLYSINMYPQKPIPLPDKPLKKPKRIRIGYFSADFKIHPVSYLIAKVIEKHNRDKFEIFGYLLVGNKEDELRKRFEKSFDALKDVSKFSDKEVALLSRQDNIDIAIDLNGYTQNSRSSIFAYRAAPVQINYLGFPGTMGADFIDYIIADQHLIPTENKKYFTEKPIYLPNTYMPTDNSREFSNRFISRSDMGLPDEAFVFCCFNNNYKITNLEFDIWMRLLIKVKGSVLWLRRSNQLSDKNIIKEAKKRNVDASRIVFADRVPIEEHLARHKLADLFIDTFAFNAHTTTTEALWAGLPVITKQGKGFAARVAGSLLKAIGLPELITKNVRDYENLIFELATNTNKLKVVKDKISENRLSKPLFDTELYLKHIEYGYQQAYQNYFDGKPPETIIVTK